MADLDPKSGAIGGVAAAALVAVGVALGSASRPPAPAGYHVDPELNRAPAYRRMPSDPMPQKLYVDTKNGDDSADCTDVSKPCKTIMGALEHAQPGGEVVVAVNGMVDHYQR